MTRSKTAASAEGRGPSLVRPAKKFNQGFVGLLFFAHRALAEAADEVLLAHGFGRAHHRVLFFVARSPGIAVMELLAVLRVTPQGINRVMNDLLKQGLVERLIDDADGRMRRLYLTPAGNALEQLCAAAQHRVLARAFRGRDAAHLQAMTDILAAFMSHEEHEANKRFLPPPVLEAGGSSGTGENR